MSTTDETPVAPPAQEAPAQEVPAQEEVSAQEPEDSLEKAQVDGSAVDPGHGSELADTKFSVEVKLADLQADPNNPLYSAKSFEELQL
jgi:ATP-dependent RNA helicase DDX19/DBP5